MSLILAAALAAAPFADLDAIDRQVSGFTGAGVGEPGGAQTPVDRRLRLRPCASPLALSWRSGARDSVVVQCGDNGGWRLFVPVVQGGPGMIQPPVISRGDAVSISIQGEGFSVSRPGEALESGPVGAWIRVRPVAASGPASDPLRAQVVRPGLVALPLP